MSIKKEDILDAIANMSVMEVVELISAMEEKFGVSAQAAVAVAAPAAAGDAGAADAAAEKTEFDLVITDAGSSKVAVIKVVRALTDLGLKEAKEKADSVPSTIKEGMKKEDAEAALKQLEEAGAKAELK